ncbi:MAG TPA: bacteriohopanetetrol glucosamine biosynthesis glycosyltransferase HpnI [Dongiaceae bacterium]|nr:bacteriohopanetetrol glucosamine biosynthesis glycosyltransferase HpnI [Dongiaceae bacterium]
MMIEDFFYGGILRDAGWLCLLIAGAGFIYTLAAAFCVKQFFRAPGRAATSFPPVSILKPLHGDEAGLRSNLEMLCRLDYPGDLEIVFGVQDAADPAITQVRRLQRDYPAARIALVIDSSEHGSNRKISNVINMMPSASHDILVLSDSDIGIDRDYLTRIVGELAKPEIGLVTCLYRGQPHPGLWPRLGSMAIDYNFLPSVIFGMKVGLAKPCFGSTMALRQSTLVRIGGFQAFANQLADDNAIGEAVRRIGLEVAIPPMVVTHACAENRLRDLITHEIRWSRTIRLVAGAGFAGSVITHPLPFAVAAVLAHHGSDFSLAVLAATILARFWLRNVVDQAVGLKGRSSRWWLLPIRDTLSFIVFCATFFVGKVTWRGRQFVVGADGTFAAVEEL